MNNPFFTPHPALRSPSVGGDKRETRGLSLPTLTRQFRAATIGAAATLKRRWIGPRHSACGAGQPRSVAVAAFSTPTQPTHGVNRRSRNRTDIEGGVGELMAWGDSPFKSKTPFVRTPVFLDRPNPVLAAAAGR